MGRRGPSRTRSDADTEPNGHGLVAGLDLIISTDTSAAHLSAVLGRPTWLLLSAKSEWRWELERETNPWHPTMRLFRQARLGDWQGVVDQAATELAELVAGRRAT